MDKSDLLIAVVVVGAIIVFWKFHKQAASDPTKTPTGQPLQPQRAHERSVGMQYDAYVPETYFG